MFLKFWYNCTVKSDLVLHSLSRGDYKCRIHEGSAVASTGGTLRKRFAALAALAVPIAVVATVLSSTDSASAVSSVQAGPRQLAFGTPAGVATTRYVDQGGNGNAAIFTITKPSQGNLVIPTGLLGGGSLRSAPDGGMQVMQGGVMVGYIYKPWARDAAGRMLPTNFTWNGKALVQHVDLKGARFPVKADPHYTCSWSGCEVQFNKHETQTVAYGSTVGSWVPWLTIAGRYLWVWAAIALSQGKCIKIRNALWVYIYSGGYCA